MVVHANGAIQKERGFLILGNKDIKHSTEILNLLEAVNLPSQVVIMHCSGHQKDSSQIARRNQAADRAAKKASQDTLLIGALISHLHLSEFRAHYMEQDEE